MISGRSSGVSRVACVEGTRLRANWEQSKPVASRLKQNNGALPQGIFYFSQRFEQSLGRSCKQRKGSRLDDDNAGTRGAEDGEDRREVVVGRENHSVFLSRFEHDLGVRQLVQSQSAEMSRIMAGSGQRLDEPRAQRHVDEEFHRHSRSLTRSAAASLCRQRPGLFRSEPCTERDRLRHVFALKVRIVGEHVVGGRPIRHEREHHRHWNPQFADAWPSAENISMKGDAVEPGGHRASMTGTKRLRQVGNYQSLSYLSNTENESMMEQRGVPRKIAAPLKHSLCLQIFDNR